MTKVNNRKSNKHLGVRVPEHELSRWSTLADKPEIKYREKRATVNAKWQVNDWTRINRIFLDIIVTCCLSMMK